MPQNVAMSVVAAESVQGLFLFYLFIFFLTKHPKLTKAHVLNSRCNLASILMDEVLVVKDSRAERPLWGQSVRPWGRIC